MNTARSCLWLLLSLVLVLGTMSNAFAAAAGPNSPSAAAGTNWTAATDVFSSNDVRATYSGTGQDDLAVTGFGFAIPAGATINGIILEVEGSSSGATSSDRQYKVGLTKDGSTLAGSEKTAQQFNSTESFVVSGNSTDLWGDTWTDAEINSANFGILLADNDTTANGTFSVDFVRITIIYTPAAAWTDSPMLHNSNRFAGTTKHSGDWGTPTGQYGAFVCGTCHVAGSTNIKRIRENISFPDSSVMPSGGVSTAVTFLDAREGTSDFGDDARADKSQSSNVCEVCHTYDAAQLVGVKFHGYDMTVGGDPDHYNMGDCMTCHPHSQGFKPEACDSCHGFPPTDTSSGGPTGLANDPHTTGSTTAGSHQKHAVDLGYACSNCHDNENMPQVSAVNSPFGDISIGFNTFGVTTGSYGGQATVSYNNAFGDGTQNCSNVYCHSTGQSADGTSATPSAYSTPSWSGAAACGTCHSDTDPATGAHTKHIADGATCDSCHIGNNHVDRNIDVTTGTYTAGGAPGNGYGTCSTASCHDQGRGGLATTPNWGASVTDCSECHASAPTTGGHTVHLSASIAGTAIACSDCHDAATNPATETAPAVGHRDDNIDVTSGGYPVDKAKNTAFTNCTTATCHQTGQAANDYTATPNWDVDVANCTQCHAATPATGSHNAHVVTAGADCSACHTNATKDTSYNDAAHGDLNIDVAVGTYTANKAMGSAFESCSNITCHSDGLTGATGNSPVWGTAAGCAACHESTMTTGSHTAHLNDGATCDNCHLDASEGTTAPTGIHTDGNVDVYDAAAGDLGYPADQAYGSGTWTTCNAASCHDDGTGTLATTPAWGTATTDCTECHAGAAINSGSHAAHIADGANCSDCHDAATDPATETAPAAGHRDTNIDTQVALGYTQDKTKGSAYETCATASCHNDGRNSGLTQTWGTAIANCAECHATQPTTGGHTVHLAASVAGTAITCGDCHTGAVEGTTAPTEHRDGNVDAIAYDTANKALGTAFTTCSTASCHQTGQATNDYTATPVWDQDVANCTQCHAATPATGSHSAHVVDAGYDCSSCHTNAIKDTSYIDANHGDVTIDVAVGNYITNRTNDAYGTAFASCDTIACHGDGLNAGGGNTPVWGTAAGCAACHESNMTTGSHTIHLTYTSGSCVECHDNANTSTETAPGQHGDGDVDVFNTAAGDLGYPQNAAIGNGTWTGCTAASCHDDGRSANTTPNWGTPAADACAACHDAVPATGSHVSHVADAAVACTDCHTGAVQSTTKPTAGHDDGNIDTNVALGYTQDKAKGSAFETCATASCHNDGRNSGLTGTWGTTINNCAECHATQPATFAHTTHLSTTITAAISCGNCHNDAVEGTTAPTGDHRDGNVDVYNSATLDLGYPSNKALGTATGTCATSYCHGDNMPRGTTSGTTNAPNWNATSSGCNFCHDMAPAAIGAHSGKGPTDCITCHNHTNATGTGFTNASLHINGIVENDADSCTSCHAADIDGALAGVHGSHVDVAAFLSGKTVSGGDYGTNGWYTTTWTNGVPSFGCGECHPADEGISHPINGLNVDIDPALESPTAGSPKLRNAAQSTPTFISRTSVTCASVYCHSDGQATETYKTTPDWYGGTVSGNCNDCHDNGPSTGTHANHLVGIHYETLYDTDGSGLMASSGAANSAHGDPTTSDTIGCQSCHNDTVTVDVNDQNSVCATCHDGGTAPLQGNMSINTLASTHINTQPDVVFDTFSSYKSRAQIRDDITTVTELNDNWTRNNGYKAANSFDQGKAAVPGYAAGTCSNIACHNGITTPTWNTGFVGDCSNCHTSLP